MLDRQEVIYKHDKSLSLFLTRQEWLLSDVLIKDFLGFISANEVVGVATVGTV